jgi:hypothetical protein
LFIGPRSKGGADAAAGAAAALAASSLALAAADPRWAAAAREAAVGLYKMAVGMKPRVRIGATHNGVCYARAWACTLARGALAGPPLLSRSPSSSASPGTPLPLRPPKPAPQTAARPQRQLLRGGAVL